MATPLPRQLPTLPVHTPPKPRALIVFDYDMSLVEADCDEFVLLQLAPLFLQELAGSFTGPPPSWPALADQVFGELVTRMPHVTREQVIQAVAQIPVSPHMLDAIRRAVDQHEATIAIVSDANHVYIQAMLDHHELDKYIAEVHTNVSYWEEDGNRLRIKAYHPEDAAPHGCELCPTNMCKGRIVDQLRGENTYDLVMYVGDGIGDFCPATRLTSADVVFAREQKTDGKLFELLKKIQAYPHKVQARVVKWNTAEEIYHHFHEELTAMQQRSSGTVVDL